jgi:hypothetical protein
MVVGEMDKANDFYAVKLVLQTAQDSDALGLWQSIVAILDIN